MAVDLNQVQARVRRAYEKGRATRALKTSMPLLGIGALVLLMDRRPGVVLGLDALLFAIAVLLLWRGQQAGRGLFAGLAAGAIPLAFGVCMQGYQVLCRSPSLMPGCTAVCGTGGFIAGLVIAWSAQRREANSVFALSAGAVALLMGALGCACAGAGGLVGLAVGIALPIVVGQLQAAQQHA